MDLIKCEYIIKIAAILFQNAHFTLYFLFFERLFSVFIESDLQFNKHQIYFSRIMLFIFYSSFIVIMWIFGGSTAKYNTIHESCSSDYPWWIAVIYAFFDTMICLNIQILFARRLLMAHLSTFKDKINNENEQEIDKRESMMISFDDDLNNLTEDEQSDLVVILTKSTLLTFIAIITNQIALILSGFLNIPSLWLSVNSCINCWCIILMFKCHKNIFNKLCGKCNKKIISIQCLYCYSCDCFCTIHDDQIIPNRKPRHILDVHSSSISNMSASTVIS